MGQPFYLYKNKNSGTFCAEILDPETGQRICYRNTGLKYPGPEASKKIHEKAKMNARDVVHGWLKDGIPARKRGRTPIYQKRPPQTLEAVAGLAAILEAIEKTANLDADGARRIAEALRSRGLLALGVSSTAQGKQGFIKFLFDFWDYDASLRLRDRRARGKNITRRSCVEATRIIKRDWLPYFQEKKLAEITRKDLKEFGLYLRERLAAKTTNNRLIVGTTALRWAYSEKMIPESVTEGLGGFVGDERKRDIFTQEEIEKLKDPRHWDDQKAYAAFRLASTSALRSGECRALQREDIGEGVIYIRHGYNNIDGLKSTKNKEERTVYLLPEVRALLMALLEENPCTEDPATQFVFWSNRFPEKPCGELHFRIYLAKAIKKAGIEPEGRRLDFHSLRHYVATRWADATGDLRVVGKVTGHKDLKQAARYSDHTEEQKIAAMGNTAANILSFPASEKGA